MADTNKVIAATTCWHITNIKPAWFFEVPKGAVPTMNCSLLHDARRVSHSLLSLPVNTLKWGVCDGNREFC